jgi:hypothetical protein
MISRRFSTGAKRAERAPTTTRTSPLLIRFHWSYLALREMPLWRTAISRSGKRPQMRERSCAVRAISGTR